MFTNDTIQPFKRDYSVTGEFFIDETSVCKLTINLCSKDVIEFLKSAESHQTYTVAVG